MYPDGSLATMTRRPTGFNIGGRQFVPPGQGCTTLDGKEGRRLME